jgi:chemosensory pili system protein ChpC
MNAVVESVRSLWVPLDGVNLLVPNVAVAEVVNYQPLDLIQDGPEWLLGALRWRDQELPVVSMEFLCGFGLPQSERGARISILNSVKPGGDLPFYAMVTADIPRLINADADALGDSLLAVRSLPDTVADCIQIGNEEAFIPDLEIVQSLIETSWARLDR